MLLSTRLLTASNTCIDINSEMFVGYYYILQSDSDEVEIYMFGPDGFVPVTAGTKESAMCPLFYWKIKEGKSLVILEDLKGPVFAEYQFKSITQEKAITTSGKTFIIRKKDIQNDGSSKDPQRGCFRDGKI